ncbi:hypothetical protein [Shewanella polaris]|uniref:Uncharacterized protein n=1 Tax=Shewanella polaris TaxID=2588449 RepID=A0A4Y5YAT8_9GAMM|nr:hypothetical protein [Shewanella polaris]QDE29814.1 hypothetical protein FH971_01795 [Shewanella polaris]
MSKLETLRLSLEKYLSHNNWVTDKENSSENLTLWVNNQLNESITLPTALGLHHKRSEKAVNEAIEDLAEIIGEPVLRLEQKIQSLLVPAADHIHIRAAGSAIEHGKINFRTNHKIESAIYSIIKSAANSFIKKGRNNKKEKKVSKSQFIENYLSCVNTVIPAGGSFIYNLDVDLLKSDGFEGSESLQRYVNSKLANVLNELFLINVDNVTTATLVNMGLSDDIFSGFISLFADDVETIECSFDWSDTEPAPKLKANKLVFTRSHREKVIKLQAKFNSSKSFLLRNANAHLSRLDLKSDHALVRLKIFLESSERTCDAQIDMDTAQELMKTLGENIEQPVIINATAWVETTASKRQYSLSNITSISSEKEKILPLFDN